MNKYFVLIFVMLSISRTTTIFAERWPFLLDDVQNLYQEYEKVENQYIPTLYLTTQGPVYATASGIVEVSSVQVNNNVDLIDVSQLSIKSDSGFHISYYGIRSLRKIGETVQEGDIVGEVDGKWHVRIFDDQTKQWVDSFSIFPDIDRSVSMRVFDFSFARTQDSLAPRSVNELRIYAGQNEVFLDLELIDRESKKYIVPDLIFFRIGTFSQTLYKQEILSRMDFQHLATHKRIKLNIPNVAVARGYHIINLQLSSPLRSSRLFRFSIFAEKAPEP